MNKRMHKKNLKYENLKNDLGQTADLTTNKRVCQTLFDFYEGTVVCPITKI